MLKKCEKLRIVAAASSSAGLKTKHNQSTTFTRVHTRFVIIIRQSRSVGCEVATAPKGLKDRPRNSRPKLPKT